MTAALRSAIPLILLGMLMTLFHPVQAQTNPRTQDAVQDFVSLLGNNNPQAVQAVVQRIEQNWHPGFVPMTLEVMRFANDSALSNQLTRLLQRKTGQSFGPNLDQWYRWQWRQPANFHPDYLRFKSALYGVVDRRFATYFQPGRTVDVRLDEVRWGGVLQDGIPPLRSPKMIRARDARYLQDDNIVFGVSVNGDVRAYPKRILAWHEMFVDTIGGVEYAGVYCTLCGTVVMYKTHHKGKRYQLGTSGFLYRSNKLMYDKATQSLWNTTWGSPVLGPLVGKGIELELGFVVTTTWGDWKKRHPNTQVLSLDTGHRRDYGEGVAYQNYFATQRLMFAVPKTDTRLQNKDEVLALRFADTPQTLAIYEGFLRRKPIYHDQVGQHPLVVLTDPSGANRVYDARGVRFTQYDGDKTLLDNRGQRWVLTEERLTAPDGSIRTRLPARRAFWFGWYAAYNDTRLVK